MAIEKKMSSFSDLFEKCAISNKYKNIKDSVQWRSK